MIDSLVKRYFEFQVGIQLLSWVNFVLLVITASTNLKQILPESLRSIWVIAAILVPLTFFGVWLFGIFLDRVLHFQHRLNNESTNRMPIFDELNTRLKNIENNLANNANLEREYYDLNVKYTLLLDEKKGNL